jgi:hypothetical protein
VLSAASADARDVIKLQNSGQSVRVADGGVNSGSAENAWPLTVRKSKHRAANAGPMAGSSLSTRKAAT